MRSLRFRWFWVAVGCAMLGSILWVCLLPRDPGPNLPGADKVEHVLAWFGVTTWFAALLERRLFLRLGIAMVAIGVGIEFAQHWMALGRMGDWQDVVANSVGVCAALLLSARTCDSWLARVERWLPAT